MLTKTRKWLGTSLGYLLYGTVVLVLLLWVLFPKETMRGFLEETLNRTWPELIWQVEGVTLQMPAGLTLQGIEGYGKRADKAPLVRVDKVSLRLQVLESLQTGCLEVGYRLAIGKGNGVGLVQWCGGREGVRVEGSALDIGLADIPLASRQLGRTVQGTVSGTFAAAFVPTTGERLTLEARVNVANGRLGLKRPILNHSELPFSQGRVVVHGQGETFHLEQGVVESELFDGQFAGRVVMHRDPVFSQIDVKGVLQPKNKFFKGLDNTVSVQAFRMQLKDNSLPFRITGDLSNPGIHYEGLAMSFQTLEKELK